MNTDASNLLEFPHNGNQANSRKLANQTKSLKTNLAVSLIEAEMQIASPKSPIKYQWDSAMPGLGIRKNSKGVAVYVVKYYFKGKQVLKTLAEHRRLTLDQARSFASRVKMLAKAGEDPAVLFQTFILSNGALAGRNLSFKNFAHAFIEKYSKVYKRSWKHDKQRIEYYMLPLWENRSLGEITRTDISNLCVEMGKDHPYTANRIREQLRVMYKQAIVMGYLPDNYPNPAWGIRAFKETPRDRYIKQHEMPRLLEALNQLPDNRVKVALKLDLMIGLRMSELRTLRWSYIDFEQASLRLPTTKAGRPFEQPLPDEAIALLKELPQTSAFVFPGDKTETVSASVFARAWKQICEAADLDDLRLHDIRRTVGCWTMQATNDINLVSDILNHSDPAITKKHYAQYQKNHVRKALDKHAKALKAAGS